MSYSGQYFTEYSGTTYDINTIFDTSSPGNTESTGIYATNITTNILSDLYEIYTPLGTNSNLKWPYLTNFTTIANKDLNETFSLNFIDTTLTTASYNQYPYTDGTMIVVSGDGSIYFNYPLTTITFYMIGGGGGGGASGGNYNAAAGGGSGGFLDASYSDTSFNYVNISIGAGGSGGTSTSTGGISGSPTTIYFNSDGTAYASVYGGGGGGGGKGNGESGGGGGGSGAYSSGVPTAGTGEAAVYLPTGSFSITTNGYYSGGNGEDNNDDQGGGGGGGGCGGVGGNGGSPSEYDGGNGGAGQGSVSDESGNITIYFSGGGGGGRGYIKTGKPGSGSNGGGDGGSAFESGSNASTNSHYGGGGGGAGNDAGAFGSLNVGGNGAAGVVVLFITNDMITFP